MKKIFTSYKFWLGLIILAVVGIFINSRLKSAANAPDVYNPSKDRIVKLETKDINEPLTLSGSIDASGKATITFPTSGKLAWVGVKTGDTVRKYQAIASLDKSQLEKQLKSDFNAYQAQLSQFNDTQDKYKQLKETYLLTDTDKRVLDRAQWNLENSVVQYEIQDIVIRNATIYSPISGIVVDITQPNAGVNVTPLSATFTVIDPNSIYFKTKIDQDAVMKIAEGKDASLTLDSYPDQKMASKVSYIAFTPIAGETSTVYEVRFELPQSNSDLKYRIGMDGDATLNLAEAKGTSVLPIDAISEDDNGQKYVYVLSADSKLARKDVTTGIENDNDIQILSGLTPNDQVVIKQK